MDQNDGGTTGAAGGVAGFGENTEDPNGEKEKNEIEDEEEFFDAQNNEAPLPDEDMNQPDDEDDFYDDQFEHINDVLGMEEREDLGGGENENFENEENDDTKKNELLAEEETLEEEKVGLIALVN